MACKKLFIIFIFALVSGFIFAQDADIEQAEETVQQEANYYLDRSGREPRFIQRLIWQGDEYVYRYVLIIQRRENNGAFFEIERIDTRTNMAEVSLAAGRYRYSLEVYDLFDEYAFTTNWHEFDVIRAVQPALNSFSPGNFYLDEDEVWIITVRGQNLLPETEFSLVQGNSRIRPQSVTIEGNVARLDFAPNTLYPGKFEIYALNPGGLDHSIDTFNIANRKRFDFNISLGYAPIFPLFGYLFQDGFSYDNYETMEAPFPDKFYPLSGGIRLSFLPLKRTWGNIGVDISGFFAGVYGDRDNYKTNAFIIDGYASFLYQFHFLKRTFFINLSLGAGVYSITDFSYTFDSGEGEPTSNMYVSAVGGVSFTYIFKKPWYATIGADYIQVFTPPPIDNPMPGIIRPYIMAGIQL